MPIAFPPSFTPRRNIAAPLARLLASLLTALLFVMVSPSVPVANAQVGCDPGGGTDATSVVFANLGPTQVQVQWVNFQCGETLYKTMNGFESYSQQTFRSHLWRFREVGTGVLLKEERIASQTRIEFGVPPAPSSLAPSSPTSVSVTPAPTTVSVATPPVSVPGSGCVITAPPASLGLSSFYTKYCAVDGFPIISSAVVDDLALHRAWIVIWNMSRKKPAALQQMKNQRIRFGIVGRDQKTTDMPEWSDLNTAFPETDWNTRTRGVGATAQRPLVGVGEENLLCLSNDRYRGESIAVHEFSHTFLQFGIEPTNGQIRKQLLAAFSTAKAKGKWASTYAGTNADEYWAEGVQSWFNTNLEATPANGTHNSVNTRAELKAYDAGLAALISGQFPATSWKPSCS
jgi:hypothetical protein